MNITRHNYEEFFLLYVDNELNIAQRKAVDIFVQQNPDLRSELLMLQQSVLPGDEHIVFSNKESLLKTASAPNPVNENNCEEYFVLYGDDELTNQQKDQVEQFVYKHPQHQANFELIQQAKLMPDMSEVFPNKYALYRTEENDRVTPVTRMRWWRIAAAAAVLFFVGGMGWYITNNGTNKPGKNGGLSQIDTNQAKPPVKQIQAPTQETIAGRYEGKAVDSIQEVAVIPDKKDKSNGRQKPVVILPANPNKTADMVRINQKEEKKHTPRNIQPVSNVPHTEDIAIGISTKAAEAQKINSNITTNPTKPEVVITEVDQRKVRAALRAEKETGEEEVGDGEDSDTPVIYASIDKKKNTMRGFFRKVSRVFDKATNLDPEGKEKSGIRIASFEIALK
jgi:hypothetical protein